MNHLQLLASITSVSHTSNLILLCDEKGLGYTRWKAVQPWWKVYSFANG